MYGYVRPLKAELKVKEYDAFRGAYCGLCHCLKKRCGIASRFLVNYDFTFMAMLLMGGTECSFEKKRCMVSPLRGKMCLCAQTGIELAADRSVILAFWKLRDSVRDSGFLKSLKYRAALVMLHRSYKKAAALAPDFDAVVRDRLSELSELEKGNCSSIDRAADCFAGILGDIASCEVSESRSRALRELFYHTGRFIYIIDAVDDLPDDVRNGNYNPLIYRFDISGENLLKENTEELMLTVRHSLGRISAAYQLLDKSQWSPILENIIYLGMQSAAEVAFAGDRHKKKKSRNGD